MFMSVLDTTIVNVALETLARELKFASEHDPVGSRPDTCSPWAVVIPPGPDG